MVMFMSLRGANEESDEAIFIRSCGLDTVSKNTRPTRPPSRNIFLLFLLSSLLIVSCSTSAPQTTPQIVSVYSTSAAEPWLTELYTCADSFAILTRVDDPNAADIALQIGEPEFLSSLAYPIGDADILIVTHRQSPIQNLTLAEAQVLFMGFGNPSVQVWVYAEGEDVQRVFDQLVMEGRRVSSSAFIAVSSQHMSEVLNDQPDSVGILPRHWQAGDSREVLSVGTVPVLALTKSEPQGVVNHLIGCLQSK